MSFARCLRRCRWCSAIWESLEDDGMPEACQRVKGECTGRKCLDHTFNEGDLILTEKLEEAAYRDAVDRYQGVDLFR